jgi:phage/plasmid-associated DNA primase
MGRFNLNGSWYTPKELAEMSGLNAHTIRDRLRRGFSVEEAIKVVATKDSVKEFCDASLWEDWIGMPISDLYKIYWRWCIQNGYTAVQKQGFSRQLMKMYPMLKTVPTRRGDKCYRVIRMRG